MVSHRIREVERRLGVKTLSRTGEAEDSAAAIVARAFNEWSARDDRALATLGFEVEVGS